MLDNNWMNLLQIKPNQNSHLYKIAKARDRYDWTAYYRHLYDHCKEQIELCNKDKTIDK